MKQRIKIIFAGGLLALTLFGVAAAGPLEDGVTAYQQGDYATAMRLLRPLAEQGNALAQFNLGAMFGDGLGVVQSYSEAEKWYNLAIYGAADASTHDLAVKRRDAMFVKQAREAAEQGDAVAQTILGGIYQYGPGEPQDYAQAVAWYRKAANQGNALAQGNLGVMYESGLGVPQDYAEAHMWFNLAASHASSDRDMAAKYRDEVATKMTPAQIAEAQRMAREWVPK